MKKLLYILTVGLFLSSCTDLFSEKWIDHAPEEDLNFEKVFGDYDLFRKYADHNYSFVIGHYSQLFNAMQAGMSDECQNLKVEACTHAFNSGAWNADVRGNLATEIKYPWKNSYKGIRKVNLVLENIHKVPNFPTEELKKRYVGESYYLRAMLYFQLIKRYGGVPLVTRALNMGSDNIDLPRNSYDECVAQIVKDCDEAVKYLGLRYEDADNGRATIGAARALKARTLLYAARPLNNPENKLEKWKAARDAAMDVIEMNQYTLYPDYKGLFFEVICDEIILNRPRYQMNFNQGNTNGSHFFVRFIAPQGYNGWMGTIPTQNFVDMFEDADGYPINHPNSTYDEQNPYEHRDPRFYHTILYNGRYWYNREMEFYREVDTDGNRTGIVGRDQGNKAKNESAYAIAKLWKEEFQRYNNTRVYLNYIFFRYAEILLNFAEAQNEFEGPESSYKGLSVRDAINQLRDRVGHVHIREDISNTKETMRARVRNERAVELSFEDHRLYDLMTWKEGTTYLNTPMLGMDVLKYPDGTIKYERFNLSERLAKPRIFKDYMHRYPIPQEEIYKSKVLKQNEGW